MEGDKKAKGNRKNKGENRIFKRFVNRVKKDEWEGWGNTRVGKKGKEKKNMESMISKENR